MKKPLKIGFYPQKEEVLNVVTHGAGLLLSIIGFSLLVQKALEFGSEKVLISFIIFGSSLVLLYSASTIYHVTKDLRKRFLFKIFDHVPFSSSLPAPILPLLS